MSKPRVIAGIARGRRLNTVPGDITRPITDRVKEALFNILGADIQGSVFFDVFGGTGAVGIEALSRGADFVRFVDRHHLAVRTIRQNLELTGFSDSSEVMYRDTFSILAQDPDRKFDYVFIAPPQYKEMWKQAVLVVDQTPDWLVDDGWIIVQIHPVEYEELSLDNFLEFDRREYGSTFLVFYERNEA